mgnify:CR=1 FL=1
MSRRVIMHVDLDAFFAACEEMEHPELRGKPVVVGADPKGGRGRGVVSTANYAARRFGIRSGMPISQAWRACPSAVFLPVNFELYERVSAEVMEILRSHAVRFESWGIDEAFIDVTGKVKDFDEAAELAKRIKAEIKAKLGLTCSIGIGPNKLVAKVASDVQKPDGLTVVRSGEERAFLAPMKVRKLLWVGRKTEERLREMGIETIGELAEADPAMLFEEFGKVGPALRLLAQGIDESPVQEQEAARKSIGSRSTFEKDVSDEKVIFAKLEELVGSVAERLAAEKLLCKTVTVHIRYENFEDHSRSHSLEQPTDEAEEMRRLARELVAPFLKKGLRVRQVGFSVSNLIRNHGQRKLAEFA